MSAGRTLAIALTAGLLAVPGAAFGQGTSGAGDEQYSDPLAGGEETGQPTTGSQTDDNGLSQEPDLGTTGSQTTTPTTSDESATTTDPTTATQLPNTGSDPREVILAGLALLLAGLGLRLRMADEVF